MLLGAHPEGVHRTVLAGAIWPRGVQPDVVDATLTRTAAWLGAAADGTPNLIASQDGRIRSWHFGKKPEPIAQLAGHK